MTEWFRFVFERRLRTSIWTITSLATFVYLLIAYPSAVAGQASGGTIELIQAGQDSDADGSVAAEEIIRALKATPAVTPPLLSTPAAVRHVLGSKQRVLIDRCLAQLNTTVSLDTHFKDAETICGELQACANLGCSDLNNFTSVGLVAIGTGSFEGLGNVAYLSLDNNFLASLEAGAFDGLHDLAFLGLHGNLLEIIQIGVFEGLGNMLRLDLSGNRLTTLAGGTFSGLGLLETLSLDANQIATVTLGAFTGLQSLDKLSLDGNYLTMLSHQNGFQALGNLTSLTLNSNRLISIEDGAFEGLSNLAILELKQNHLTDLGSAAFSGLAEEFSRLLLNSNHLTNVSRSFEEVGRLGHWHLDLSFNDIFVADQSALSYLCQKVVDTHWQGNPTTCNCRQQQCDCAGLTNNGQQGRCSPLDRVIATLQCERAGNGCALAAEDLVSRMVHHLYQPLHGCKFQTVGEATLGGGIVAVSTEGGDTFRLSTSGGFRPGDAGSLQGFTVAVNDVQASESCMVTPDSEISCVLPPGAGLSQTLELQYYTSKGTYSLGSCQMDYNRPNIFEIDGCSDGSARECRREGGDIVTIRGTNFGVSRSIVFGDGIEWLNCSHGDDSSDCDSVGSSEQRACHRVVVCVTPPLQRLQPETNSIKLVQKNQYGVYAQFAYTRCASNEQQKEGDGYYVCSVCSNGRESDGPDATHCERCDLWHLGDIGHCEVPVFAILVFVAGVILVSAMGALAAKQWKIRKSIHKKDGQIRANFKKNAKDKELMSAAWTLEWEEIQLIKNLARGSYGEVWEGKLRGLSVAVKKLIDSSDTDISRETEIQFMKRARHPRLVLFMGCGRIEETGDVFLVLEFCGEGDLTNYLYTPDSTNSTEWSVRVSLVMDVVVGLEYLHTKHNAVHRDMKSDNVLLTRDEKKHLRAKISDFGTSIVIDPEPEESKQRIKKHHGSIHRSKSMAKVTRRLLSSIARSPHARTKRAFKQNSPGHFEPSKPSGPRPPALSTTQSMFMSTKSFFSTKTTSSRAKGATEEDGLSKPGSAKAVTEEKDSHKPIRYHARRTSIHQRHSIDDLKKKALMKTMTSGTGTLLWMAPEIFEGQDHVSSRYGQPADIYSFGMILYEVLELKRPWSHLQSASAELIQNAVMEGKRPPISPHRKENGDLQPHKEYVQVMIDCWAHKATDRPDVEQVAVVMKRILDALPPPHDMPSEINSNAAIRHRLERMLVDLGPTASLLMRKKLHDVLEDTAHLVCKQETKTASEDTEHLVSKQKKEPYHKDTTHLVRERKTEPSRIDTSELHLCTDVSLELVSNPISNRSGTEMMSSRF